MSENLFFRKLKRLVGVKETFQWKEGIAFGFGKNEQGENVLKIFHNDVEVGSALVNYDEKQSKYSVRDVGIYKSFQGKWFGSQLIEGINGFLESKKIDGYLFADIKKPNLKAKNIYKDHGWVSVRGRGKKMEYRVKK